MNVWAAVKAKVEALKGGRLQHYGTLVAIVVVSFGFVYFQMRDLPFLAMVENWAGDFRTATQPPPQPIDPDIVIVGLTDQPLAGRSRLSGRFAHASAAARGQGGRA